MLALLLALVICNPISALTQEQIQDRAQEQDRPADANAEKQPMTVTLLEPGAEPREALRFRPEAGTMSTAAMSMRMSVRQQLSGMQMPETKIPSSNIVIDLAVTDVEDDGDIHYTMKVTKVDVADEPGVMPQVSAAMRQSLAGLVGLEGSFVMDDRGLVKQADFHAQPGMNAAAQQQLGSIRESIRQMSVPLPEQPIGIGAKWQTETLTNPSGFDLKQKTTYELVSRDGNAMTLNAEIEQTADPQELESPAPGVSMRLASFSSTGTGQVSMMLNRIMPTRSSMQAESDVTMTVKMNGQQQQELQQQMIITVEIAESEAAAATTGENANGENAGGNSPNSN